MLAAVTIIGGGRVGGERIVTAAAAIARARIATATAITA